MEHLIGFGLSAAVVPVVLFAYCIAASFLTDRIEEAAQLGGDAALFMVNETWVPRITRRVTDPSALVCPGYLILMQSLLDAVIIWVAHMFLGFAIFMFFMRRASVRVLIAHSYVALILAPLGYIQAVYFVLTR